MNTFDKKPLPWIVKFFFGRFMPWSAILLSILSIYVGISNVLNARESSSWPSVEGKVSQSEVRMQVGSSGEQSGSSSVTYHADIEYDYSVKEENYKGTRIAFGDLGTADRADADKIIKKYPKGIDITVYYKPNEPQLSLLEPGLKVSAWFPIFFGIPFLLVGAALLVFLPKTMNT